MGLDGVEIILRVEELFAIDIGDEEAAKVETVGQFYELICAKLHIIPLRSPVTSEELPAITRREKAFLFLSRHTPLPPLLRCCRGRPKVYGIVWWPSS